MRKDERKYYEELLKYSREHLMLYPYHLSDIMVKGLRVTPFSYYIGIMEVSRFCCSAEHKREAGCLMWRNSTTCSVILSCHTPEDLSLHTQRVKASTAFFSAANVVISHFQNNEQGKLQGSSTFSLIGLETSSLS